MPFEKGKVSNPNGRKKGSENKETKRIREWVGELLADNMDQVKEDLQVLSPKDRVTAIANLLEFSIPKLARTELSGDVESGFTLKVINYTQAINGKEIKELPEDIEQIE